jgi:glycosyltransferase involved in cell wall biosynthesis
VRILYVVTAFPRWPGDVITPWLTELIHRLGRRGIEIEVLAPAYRGLGGQSFDGVRVNRFRYAPALVETLTHDQTVPDRLRERPVFLSLLPFYMAGGAVAAARLARTQRFDAVHAFWPLPHALFGLAAKFAGGTPLISTFFGVELTWLRSHTWLLRPVLSSIVKHSDAVTAISAYTASMLRELAPAAEPTVIPFGAVAGDLKVPDPNDKRPSGGPFRLLFVGRLVERKGVHVLIEAVGELQRKYSVALEIVGDGPDRPQLEAIVVSRELSDLIRFHGAISAEQLELQYLQCDAFVLPAIVDSKGDTEGLGVVLIEALSNGKPVIASDVGGIPDIVQDGRTGLLVPPGDVGALAQAITRYIDEPGLARRLAELGRQHVEDVFSWERITEKLASLYDVVAQRRSSRS